jgi:hypothetical protein
MRDLRQSLRSDVAVPEWASECCPEIWIPPGRGSAGGTVASGHFAGCLPMWQFADVAMKVVGIAESDYDGDESSRVSHPHHPDREATH